MKYSIDWNFSSTYNDKKCFSCEINVKEDKYIERIYFSIVEDSSYQKYGFSITTVYDHTDAPSPYYNHEKTRAIQKNVKNYFNSLKLDIND